MDYATIIEHNHPLPLGQSYTTYEWQGDPWQLSRITPDLEHYHNPLFLFPWPMKVVRREGVLGQWVICARTDGLLFISAYTAIAHDRVLRLLKGIKSRLILTLHIWGVGYTDVQVEEFVWRSLLRKSPWRKW